MGNSASFSLYSVIKSHVYTNKITDFINEKVINNSNNNKSEHEYLLTSNSNLSNQLIRPSKLIYNLTHSAMINGINDTLELFYSNQMVQYNSENLYQVLLFPYLYDGHQNEKLSLIMNNKLNDILGISINDNSEHQLAIEKSKTFSNVELKENKEKEKPKNKKTYFNYNSLVDKRSNLSFDELNFCDIYNKEVEECEKILALSRENNHIYPNNSNFCSKKKISCLEEEKNTTNNNHIQMNQFQFSKQNSMYNNKKLNSFKNCSINKEKSKTSLKLKTQYSNVIRNINLKHTKMKSFDIPNLPIKSTLFSFNSQYTKHENSLRNYFQENLSPDRSERIDKKEKNKTTKTLYKIDLGSPAPQNNTDNYVLSTINSGQTFSVRRASRYTTVKKKENKKSNKKTNYSTSKFINKIDFLYGIDLNYKEKINEKKNRLLTEKKKHQNETLSSNNQNKNTIETFQGNNMDYNTNKDSVIEKDLDFLENLTNSNNFASDNSDNHNFLEEIVSNKKTDKDNIISNNNNNTGIKRFSYSKYLDMPYTQQKLKMCKSPKADINNN